MRYQKLLLLLLLFISPLWSQTRLKYFELKEIAAPFGVLQVEHPDCAVVVVRSAIPGIRFVSNMDRIKEQRHIPLESRYVIYIYPDKQIIAIKASGYVETRIFIPGGIKAREQLYYELNEAYNTQGKGDFLLSTDPPGADIAIDLIPVFNEKTPFEFKQFGAIDYNITLSKERYEKLSATINIEADKQKSQNFRLKALFAELEIESEPSGSTVYINKINKGITPLSLTGAEKGLDEGEYEIVLRPLSQFLEPLNQKLILKADTRENLKLKHRDNSGVIQVETSHEPTVFYLNDQPDTELSQSKSTRLKGGNYNIKAVYTGEHKNAFDPIERSVDLGVGDKLLLPFSFNPRLYKFAPKIEVKDLDIELTDNETGAKKLYTDFQQIPPLFPGTYTLQIKKTGYRNLEEQIVIRDRDLYPSLQMIEIDRLYKNKLNGWRVSKYSSGASFIVALAATAYFTYSTFDNYDKYKSANTVPAVANYKDKAIAANKAVGYSLAIDVISGSWWVYSHYKHRHWRQRMDREMQR